MRFRLVRVVSLAYLACGTLACGVLDSDGLDNGEADDFGTTDLRCGAYPRARIDTAPNMCAGIVASSEDKLFKPRVLLELPDRPNEFLVTDLAGWAPGKGRVWYMDARSPEAVRLEPILEGLTLPHQLIVGPGGWLYLGEDARISAFPPGSIGADGSFDAAKLEVVLDGLPPMDIDGERNSMHPISHFIFDDEGNLFVNVGAYTDHCNGFAGRECQEIDARLDPSLASDPHHWGAVIRRYARVGERAFDSNYTIVAHGLRNSMGLAFAPNGDLIQVENSRDFPEGDRPFEELNIIPRAEVDGESPPHHYGFPYCYDAFETSDEWVGFEGFLCSPDNPEYRPPHILLPPHGAPLGLAYYQGDLFDELRGTLLVPLHGYRPAGQRMVTYDVDDNGHPVLSETATYLENPETGISVAREYPRSEHGVFTAEGKYLIEAYFEVPGFRPKGAPVAPYVSSDGAIWIADDKNKTILRFDRTDENLPVLRQENLYPAYRRALDEDQGLLDLYEKVVDDVLHSEQCKGCHDDFRVKDDESRYPELRYLLALGTWIEPGQPEKSALFTKLNPVGQASMPPLGREWDTQSQGEDAVSAVEVFIRALPVLTPGLNDGWIGGQCTPGFDSDCDYDGGICAPEGYCTHQCTRARPFCPGDSGTFCVDVGNDVGSCVATCDPETPTCLDGQECVVKTRFGRTTPEKGVCLPAQQ